MQSLVYLKDIKANGAIKAESKEDDRSNPCPGHIISHHQHCVRNGYFQHTLNLSCFTALFFEASNVCQKSTTHNLCGNLVWNGIFGVWNRMVQLVWVFEMVVYLVPLHSLYYCCDKYEQIFVTNMSKCLWQLWANVCGKYDQIFTTNVFRYLRHIYANICVLIWLSEKLLHLSTSWSSPWSHLEIIWSIINIFAVIVIFVKYRQHCHHWHHCNQQQQHHYCQK